MPCLAGDAQASTQRPSWRRLGLTGLGDCQTCWFVLRLCLEEIGPHLGNTLAKDGQPLAVSAAMTAVGGFRKWDIGAWLLQVDVDSLRKWSEMKKGIDT